MIQLKNNRIQNCFNKLREKGKKAFIPYIAAGVPTIEDTYSLILQLEKSGSDIIELGYPFSDPMADGPVNQAAADHALNQGLTRSNYFELIRKIRKVSEIPLVVFTYLNPVFAYGYQKFIEEAKEAGADGVLIVDLPIEESEEYIQQCQKLDLANIFLASPTTTPDRLQNMVKHASGFLYYISRTGVTGERNDFQFGFEEKLKEIKSGSDLPVAVGFGISTPEHVQKVCQMADGAIVGSALVKRTMENKPYKEIETEITEFIQTMSQPTKA